MVSLFRLDFRLLHYQTSQVWPPKVGANQILVANDSVVNDSLRISLMKMAMPRSCSLKVLSIDDTIKYLNGEDSKDKKIELLVDSTADALKLAQNVSELRYLNAGLMKGGEGKKLITPSLAFAPEDYDNYQALVDLGVTVESFVTPDDRRVPITNYLRK